MESATEVLLSGGICVLRTDTLYGIVARADDKLAVRKVHQYKQRSPDKPLIVLIASANDAYDGGDIINKYTQESALPVSVIVPSPHAPTWLRHPDGTVAYRVPRIESLRQLLTQTGPLVAPSANPEGLTPARTIEMAQNYFGEQVDAYIDGGEVAVDMPPSRIIRVNTDGTVETLR